MLQLRLPSLRKPPQRSIHRTWAHPHQRCCGHARRQPQHAALMGAALRLPRAAPHRRRAPPVRPRRDRGAALRLRGDAQHLLGGRAGARARRRAGDAVATAQRVRALRRGRRRPRARGEPGGALGRADGRGGPASRGREPPTRRRGRRARVRLRVALGHRLAGRGDTRRAPGDARRGRARLRRQRAVRHGRAARPGARAVPAPARTADLDVDGGAGPVPPSRALHALEPRAVVLTGRRASLDALGRLVYAARRMGGDEVTSTTSEEHCRRPAPPRCRAWATAHWAPSS